MGLLFVEIYQITHAQYYTKSGISWGSVILSIWLKLQGVEDFKLMVERLKVRLQVLKLHCEGVRTEN